MANCVIDIETCALDEAEVASALVEKLKAAAEDDEDWREKLALYALGASVVTIGLYSPETGRAAMLYDDRHGAIDSIETVPRVDQVTLIGGDERKILEEFWGMVPSFGCVVSYNGRGFDVPFLLQRSLIHELTVSRNLMPPRFSSMREHMDLAEVLSQFRATRPYGLEAWSQALGVKSPKEGEVKGAEVSAAFREGRIREIVDYCLRDVVATAEIAARVSRDWGKALNLPAIRFNDG
jgi:DNA polymerase elongation subunit (family B)